MTLTGHWILSVACALLGIVDIAMVFKTPKEGRTKLHWVLCVCGAVVLIMGVIQIISLIVRGQPM